MTVTKVSVQDQQGSESAYSKISKSNCVTFRRYSVQNKATKISFCHFVNSTAYISIVVIPSNCKNIYN